MKHTKAVAWAKHEARLDLRKILEDNFLCYDGDGPIPEQLEVMDKAKGLWYVPDPAKQGDIELIRTKKLIKDAYDLLETPGKTKEFRTEVIRAAFKQWYKDGDYQSVKIVGLTRNRYFEKKAAGLI